jgi:ATP-binding cassette, subfamily C (CFTR/MRP), member 1
MASQGTPASYGEPVHDQTLTDEGDRQGGDLGLYTYYFRAIGWGNFVGMAISLLVFSVFQRLPTLWVLWWTEAEKRHPGKDTDMYAGVYGVFGAICVLSFPVAIYLLFQHGIPRSSNQLHASLLKAVMDAPYWSFTATDTGEIVTKFYLRTSRQIRLLDLEAKAPLYSHFIEVLKGITTIRAFGWQQVSSAENAALLDTSQRPFYLMYSVQRWLNLVLDLLVAAIATIIVVLSTQLSDSSAGALGVSLLNIFSFSQDLTYLVRTWTEMETPLGAISRVKTFETMTPSEHTHGERVEPNPDWPSNGRVELKSLSSFYK